MAEPVRIVPVALPPMVVSHVERRDRQEEAILTAALKRLRGPGPEAVTVRSLADDTGYSSWVVYKLYGSKDGLFEALVAHGYDRLDERCAQVVEAHADPFERLTHLGLAFHHFARDEPALFKAMFLGSLRWDRTEGARRRHDASFALVEETVAAVIDAGVMTGDPHDVAHLLWAGVMGVATQELGGHVSAADGERLLQQMTVSVVTAHIGPNG